MAHAPLPIHLIPTRGLWPAGSSVVPTRETHAEFLVTGGSVSGTASDYPEESGVAHGPYFRGIENSRIEIIPGVADYAHESYGQYVHFGSSQEGDTSIRPISPSHLMKQLALVHKEEKIERFAGVVNCFTHRRGRTPSNGFFLVLKSDLGAGLMDSFDTQVRFHQSAIPESSSISLASEDNNTVTIKSLFLVQAVAITPVITGPEFDASELSAASDVENQVYLIELADRRALGKFVDRQWPNSDSQAGSPYVSEQSYNVRIPADNPADSSPNNVTSYTAVLSATDEYYESTTYTPPGSIVRAPFTWETMFTNLWETMGLVFSHYDTSTSTYQSLDFSYAEFPTHIPENYKSSDSEDTYAFFFDILDSIFHTLVRKLDGSWYVVGPGNVPSNLVSSSPRDMMRIARHHIQDSLNHVDTRWNRIPAHVTVRFPRSPGTNRWTDNSQLFAEDGYDSDYGQYVVFQVETEDLTIIPSSTLSYANSYSEHSGAGTYTGALSVGVSNDFGETGNASLVNTNFTIHDRLRARFGIERPNDPLGYAGPGGDFSIGYIAGNYRLNSADFINWEALITRAKELARLYRDFVVHTDPLVYRKYNGYWKFEGTHKIEEITWGDTGDGPFTILNNPSRKSDVVTKMVRPKIKKAPPANRVTFGRIVGTAVVGGFGTYYDAIQPNKKGSAILLNDLRGDASTGVVMPSEPYATTPGFPGNATGASVTVHNIHHTRSLLPGDIVPIIWDAPAQCWCAVSTGGAPAGHGTEIIKVIAQEDFRWGTSLYDLESAYVNARAHGHSNSEDPEVEGPEFEVLLTHRTMAFQVTGGAGISTQDPNVLEGQAFYAAHVNAYDIGHYRKYPYQVAAAGEAFGTNVTESTWVAIYGHLDHAIGTTILRAKGWSAQGWGKMDGVQNSSENGGSGISMIDFIPVGATDMGGIQDEGSIGTAEGSLNTDGTAKDPPTHTENTTPETATTSSEQPGVYSNDDHTKTPPIESSEHTNASLDYELLSDYTTHGQHAHDHTVAGVAHRHVIGDRPATKHLAFFERLNNAQ